MIGYLSGQVKCYSGDMTTLDVGCVGYEIHVITPGIPGNFLHYWIHEHAPQDAPHELYGFREREQRDMFRRLLEIKGVGPKVAMRMIASGAMNIVDFGERAKAFCRVRGVGTVLAQRVCEALQ